MARDDAIHFQEDFSAAELAGRRRRAMGAMTGGLAVVAGAGDVPGFDPFRQSNDFSDLTGVEAPLASVTRPARPGRRHEGDLLSRRVRAIAGQHPQAHPRRGAARDQDRGRE